MSAIHIHQSNVLPIPILQALLSCKWSGAVANCEIALLEQPNRVVMIEFRALMNQLLFNSTFIIIIYVSYSLVKLISINKPVFAKGFIQCPRCRTLEKSQSVNRNVVAVNFRTSFAAKVVVP